MTGGCALPSIAPIEVELHQVNGVSRFNLGVLLIAIKRGQGWRFESAQALRGERFGSCEDEKGY